VGRFSFVQFYPTLRCNQGCSFCFNIGTPDAVSYRGMNVQDARLLGNLLIKAGVPEVDVLGGEPLLIPWIKDFVKEMTDSGISVHISTNGSLPEIVDDLSGIQTNLMNIGFSIHGFSKTHNSLTRASNFSKALLGVRGMVENGRNPIVKSVLTGQNMREISELVAYLKYIGVKRYFLLHEDIIGRQKTTARFSFPGFREFFTRLKESFDGFLDVGFVAASGFYKYGTKSPGRCDAGVRKIAIMPDGSVFPCNLFSGLSEFRLGNIFQDGLNRIWESPLLDYFRKYTGGNRCKRVDCKYYSTCTGGCPAHSYFFCGNPDDVDPRCLGETNI